MKEYSNGSCKNREWECYVPVIVFHFPLPRGIAVEVILREITPTCIPLPHGGYFLINSTASPPPLCRQSHCPLEITFPRIAAWRGTVFLRVSPGQCGTRISKSQCTFTDPQWRKMNQYSSFPPHFQGPFPGIPGGGVGWGPWNTLTGTLTWPIPPYHDWDARSIYPLSPPLFLLHPSSSSSSSSSSCALVISSLPSRVRFFFLF